MKGRGDNQSFHRRKLVNTLKMQEVDLHNGQWRKIHKSEAGNGMRTMNWKNNDKVWSYIYHAMAIYKDQLRSIRQASDSRRNISTVPVCNSVEHICILEACHKKRWLLNPLQVHKFMLESGKRKPHNKGIQFNKTEINAKSIIPNFLSHSIDQL